MISSFYAGALKAAVAMGRALGEDVAPYEDLLAGAPPGSTGSSSTANTSSRRWNGRTCAPRSPPTGSSTGSTTPSEAAALLEREGPKYQYGAGCLSDGVLGSWLALACGVGQVLDPEKVRSHLKAVHRHNFKRDLAAHANPQRATYANVTSILDPALERAVAQEMLRVLKPDGAVLWFDFRFNNPWNPHVRGIGASRIGALFPDCAIELAPVLLAPPIGRLIAGWSWPLAEILSAIPLLRTHYVGLIRKK